jgi:hypothetical protein
MYHLAGTRPGHPAANLVFNFVFAVVQLKLITELRRIGLLPKVCLRGLFVLSAAEGTDVEMVPLAFMDDIFVPVDAEDSLQLFEHVEMVASLFVQIAVECGLEVSFAQGKSEAILQFAGPRTCEARERLCELVQHIDGEDPVPRLPLSGGGHSHR